MLGLCPCGPDSINGSLITLGMHVTRSGMVSDSGIAELHRLRRVLAGKDPTADMMGSRQGSSMSSLSMLRGSVLSSMQASPPVVVG